MLVAADGRTWGGVSGGCLERDVSRRARNVIATQIPIICMYDTSDELDEIGDEAELIERGQAPGVTLGCRGVIDILIQRISLQRPGPMPLIRRCICGRETVVNVTVVRASQGSELQPGDPYDMEIEEWPARPELRECDGAELFVETLRPPQSLVVFGGGSDVAPVVELAHVLGWHVTVAKSRPASESPVAGVSLEPGSAVVLMTHDVVRDQVILRELAGRPLKYLGILGPRSRTDELLARIPPEEVRAELFYPVGLDIGADQPELIALAIVGEIQGVLSGRTGGSLRDRSGPIYPPAEASTCEPRQ